MAGGFEAAVDRTCGRWVAWVAGRPGAVLAGVAAVTVGLAAFAAFTMGINADPRTLVDPTLPFQVRQRDLGKTFHSLADGILLVVDADSPSVPGRGRRPAPRSGAHGSLREIDVPGSGRSAKNALLYRPSTSSGPDRSPVGKCSRAFAARPSLVDVADLLRQVLEAEREGRATGVTGAPCWRGASHQNRSRAAARPIRAAIMGAALPRNAPAARRRCGRCATRADAPDAPELAAVRGDRQLELPPDGPRRSASPASR
jgi:hypothetical protein